MPHARGRACYQIVATETQNIRGENGNFFLNAKGRLCATQRVTLTNVSEILQATNAVLGEYAKDQLAVFEKGRDDPALVRAIRRELLERMDFLTLKGQQLLVRAPMSAQMFAEWKKETDAQEGIDFLQKLGIRIQHKGHLLTLELGRVNGRETVAIGTLPKRKYVPNALTHVKAKYGLEDGFNPAQTRDLFFRKADTRYKK